MQPHIEYATNWTVHLTPRESRQFRANGDSRRVLRIIAKAHRYAGRDASLKVTLLEIRRLAK